MALESKRSAALVLRLIVGLALLGWPRVGTAQGTWSVISLPPRPGDVVGPNNLAVDAVGNLYVAEVGPYDDNFRIEKRDAQGNWSILAARGTNVGQVYNPRGLAVDGASNLYVADANNRIEKRDAQGNWSVIADFTGPLAVDSSGNLYVGGDVGIQKRDAQGNWSVIATGGDSLGPVSDLKALAVDTAGNLYVAGESGKGGRIQKRDAQGNWSVIATWDWGAGPVWSPIALAADSAGNLYVAEYNSGGYSRIQKQDTQGNWFVVATAGADLGQVNFFFRDTFLGAGLAVDAVANLYVADTGNNRVLMYTPGP